MSSNYKVVEIAFERAAQPTYKEVKSKGYVEYGDNNDYPIYLINLAQESAKHGGIIKGKVNYIVGKGFRCEDKRIDAITTYKESLTDVLKRCIFDDELQGGYYVMVTWNLKGEIATIDHVPYHKIRVGIDKHSYYFKDDWKDNKEVARMYKAFSTTDKTGSQIICNRQYSPLSSVYSLPPYYSALNYIVSDIEVSRHILGNALNGFTGSKLIQFNDGEPDEEGQRQIDKRFEKRFTGSDGKRYVLVFNKDASKRVSIDDLGTSQLTKEDFTNINRLIEQEILTGHTVTSGMLFGIKTEGQLGGTTELATSYEVFTNTYVNARQMAALDFFKYLIKFAGIQAELELIPTAPLSSTLSESLMLQILSKEEIRERYGYENKDAAVAGDVKQTLAAINSLSPLVANKVLNNLSVNELRALIGASPKADGDVIGTAPQQQFSKQEATDILIDMFSKVGEPKTNFISLNSIGVKLNEFKEVEGETEMYFASLKNLSGLEVNILDLISKDKRLEATTIAKALNVSEDIVKRVLKGLEDTKILERNANGERKLTTPISEVRKQNKPQTVGVQLRYSYEVKPGLGAEIIEGTRDFCRRLIELDRLYSRFEIEEISRRVGYSVWEKRGGFYHNPKTNITTESCRHIWKSQSVIRKIN